MKKIISVFLVVLSTCLFTSCIKSSVSNLAKDYTCKCTTTTNDNGNSSSSSRTSVESGELSKDNADKDCKAGNSSSTSTNYSTVTDCQLQ